MMKIFQLLRLFDVFVETGTCCLEDPQIHLSVSKFKIRDKMQLDLSVTRGQLLGLTRA